MSERLFIAVPTKGRAGMVTTNVPGQILVVDQSQREMYSELNRGAEIEVCPNFKSLAEKRNWIVDRFGHVFMLDDDIEKVIDMTTSKQITPDLAKKRIVWLYELALELGISLFGFNNSPSPKHYNAMKPIVFKGFINGAAIGVIKNDKLRFTKETVAAEDYYINLINAYHFRRNLIDKRFCFKQNEAQTFVSPGGQSLNRTMETEKNDTFFLRKMFGESVILKNDIYTPDDSNPYARQLNIRL